MYIILHFLVAWFLSSLGIFHLMFWNMNMAVLPWTLALLFEESKTSTNLIPKFLRNNVDFNYNVLLSGRLTLTLYFKLLSPAWYLLQFKTDYILLFKMCLWSVSILQNISSKKAKTFLFLTCFILRTRIITVILKLLHKYW